MFTIEYKGFYIHGYCGKDYCKVISNGLLKRTVWFQSVLAAKRCISRSKKRAGNVLND